MPPSNEMLPTHGAAMIQRIRPFIFCVLLLFPFGVSAQERPNDPDENAGGVYQPGVRQGQLRTPSLRVKSGNFFFAQVNVDSLGMNIVGDAANEPSIAVDPTNPNGIVIGWRQFDDVNNSFRQAGYSYTTDGGQSWTFPGAIEPGIFRSDPVLDTDDEGHFYYYSLSTSGSYTCEVFKSTNGGSSWSAGVPAYGGDKGWMMIDKTGGPGNNNIYCFSRDDVATNIVLTRSFDRGGFFHPLINVPGNPGRGTIAAAADGAVYAAGRSFNNGLFVVARSSDLYDSASASVFEFSRQVDMGGSYTAYAGPNPGGLLGQMNVACAPDSNTVYLLSSVDPPGTDLLDVYFIQSTDRGTTWGSPVRINDDSSTSAWQWFGTMSVAPNGRIDVVWLDTRDDPGTYLSSLYYSYSMDNGLTWSSNQRLSQSFDPHVGWPQQQKMGDYFHMVSDISGAHLAWAATFNSEEDVYYGFISAPTSVPAFNTPLTFSLDQNYPNPFNPTTHFGFRIAEFGFVTLSVYDLLGREVATLINEEKHTGAYSVTWNAVGFSSGTYFYRLQVGNFTSTRRMVLVK